MLLPLLLATAPIRLQAPRPVRPGLAAFPEIAAPADAAQRRINAALAKLDARAKAAARECLTGARWGDWQRQVDATMRGPEFLSFLVTDDVDCGGAHPSDAHSAIVYDLRTGAPVDWTKLLPRALVGELALTEGEDGVKVVTLGSPRLFALYRRYYQSGHSNDKDLEDDCKGAIEYDATGEDGDKHLFHPLLAWLDAKAGGLGLQYDFGHAMQACSAPAVIPVAVLRREGADARLLDALSAAHAAASAHGR